MAEELFEQEEAPSIAAVSKPVNAHLEFKICVCVIVMKSGQFVTERDAFRARTQRRAAIGDVVLIMPRNRPADARLRRREEGRPHVQQRSNDSGCGGSGAAGGGISRAKAAPAAAHGTVELDRDKVLVFYWRRAVPYDTPFPARLV